jgi:hypothetical protein
MTFEEFASANRPCQHTEWVGRPEGEATCKSCGMDEFEVNTENEKLLESYNKQKDNMEIPEVVILECQRRVYGMMAEAAKAKRRCDRAKRLADERHADYIISLEHTHKMIQFLVDNAGDPGDTPGDVERQRAEVKGELEAALDKELQRPEDSDDEEIGIFTSRTGK